MATSLPCTNAHSTTSNMAIYAVVLDTIRTIKILRRSPNPDKLRFIPINTNDYDEQEFDKSRIINVFEVIGSISKFF